ncbi:MAG: DJ-1/PfpI family protein [Candidatus Aureabacteria bacterium]|nr:DJ-1/PfpI family protein [Candidatus Auribacterota bacterium]
MKKLFVMFLNLLVFISFCGINHAFASKEEPKAVFIIASSNFRDEELFIPMRIFRRAAWEVEVVSSVKGKIVGIQGNEIEASKLVYEMKPGDYDVIIFVGGNGATEYWNDPTAHNIVKIAVKDNKILGAIGIAPIILANAGILKGRKATSWEAVQNRLRIKGVVCLDKTVVIDNVIVTARGPKAAEEFANALLTLAEKHGYGIEYKEDDEKRKYKHNNNQHR